MSRILPAFGVLLKILVLGMVLCPSVVAARNIAVVIGNSEYSYLTRLPNAARDAEAMDAAFSDLGYEVFKGTNLTLQQMRRLLVEATSNAQKLDTIVFFYAGHGVQMGGSNFLLASNADGSDKRSLRKGSIDVTDVVQELSRFATSTVVILDACRDNPFATGSFGDTASASAAGLADLALPTGSYVAFSTKPGQAALDGGGRNSPFTESILRHIRTPGATVQDIMQRVRKDVSDTTGGAQVPFEKSALLERVVFSAPETSTATKQIEPVNVPVQTPSLTETYKVTHVVQGLNPKGDGFLSLRVAPSAQTSELRKLIEGTKLSLLGTEGRWMRVRLLDGQDGWVHSNWVAKANSDAALSNRQPVAQSAAPLGQTCDALWLQRNTIFHNHGYCFSSARGRAAFSNATCKPGLKGGNVPLTPPEKSLISQIQSQERQMGC
jgi:uncharacterized caspase-like protein